MIYQPIHSILCNQLIEPNTIKYLRFIATISYQICESFLSQTEIIAGKKLVSDVLAHKQIKKPWKSSIYFHCTLDNAYTTRIFHYVRILNVLYECIEWNEIGKKKKKIICIHTGSEVENTLRWVYVWYLVFYMRKASFSVVDQMISGESFFSINVAVDIAEWVFGIIVQFFFTESLNRITIEI